MEKIVVIVLQNTEKLSKRKTASKNISIPQSTSQSIPIHESEIAHSGQPVVPGKYLTSFKLKNFEQT